MNEFRFMKCHLIWLLLLEILLLEIELANIYVYKQGIRASHSYHQSATEIRSIDLLILSSQQFDTTALVYLRKGRQKNRFIDLKSLLNQSKQLFPLSILRELERSKIFF